MREDSFKEFVLDQLHDLKKVTCRAMFGGYGLYQGKTFFGILYNGRLYFKTNQMTRSEYIEKGMKPFRPSAKMTLKNYYEVPADILEDPDQLEEWAKKAISCGSPKKQDRSRIYNPLRS
ncbi:MAG: TfoX/Sxy family protein [Nitrospira sp.]|nr:TfoX/Sxy family protein [Nitrospira sp.]